MDGWWRIKVKFTLNLLHWFLILCYHISEWKCNEILVNPVEVVVKQENLKWIIICNILGVLLFGSWYITQFSGFWFEIDKAIFYVFNEQLTLSRAFMYFVAFINLRAFDIVAFVAMLAIFYSYYRKSNVEGKRQRLFWRNVS